MEDSPAPPRRRLSPFLAVLPAFLLTIGMSTFSILRFAGVQPHLGITAGAASPAAHRCAKVYGINLYNSEYYVREALPGSGIPSNKRPTELSTVLSGMVENTCSEPLRSVAISLKVQDSTGRKGHGEAVVREIAGGQAKPFERAWIGQIISYEVVSIR